jgi:hypothetical protein
MSVGSLVIPIADARGRDNEVVPTLRSSIESFIEKLRQLDPNEAIAIDADMNRDPIARFVRQTTGEIVGEINQPPEYSVDTQKP